MQSITGPISSRSNKCSEGFKKLWKSNSSSSAKDVSSYYVAFCCCNRLVILLFQLSLKINIHGRFDNKLSTYVWDTLNLKCTVRKEIFVVLQTKRSLVRREEEKNWKFLHSVNHVFQISKFSSQLKVTTLSNINTISKTKVVLPFKLTIFFIWQHEPISLVKLRYKIGNNFYPLSWNLDFSPPEKKKKIKKYIYI